MTLLRGGAAAGASYRLGAASCGAGKSQGPILFPEDPFLAPLHATFFFKDGQLWVRDEKSASGIFVRIHGEEPLSPGQMFAAGDRLLRFAGALPPPPVVAPPVPYGAPAPALLYTLEELVEGGRPGRVCVRPGPVIAVGNAGCELSFTKDPLLAARHCEVVIGPSGAVLRDLGSPEGTFVRLAPGQERALQPGSAVRLGKQVLKVELAA